MGKIEQIKLARKMLREEQRQGRELRQYRNKIFAYGFIAGALVAVAVTSAFFNSRSSKTTAATSVGLPSISTGSATLAPNINLPSNLQIPVASPTPGI